MKFLHTMVRVKDIQKSLDFYQNILNLNLVKTKRLSDCTLYFLTDNYGEVQIELTYNDETPNEGYNLGNAFGHFAFETKNMEEFTKKLHNYGYEYLYEPYRLNEVGSLISFIKDPDGYEIEIIER